MKRLTIYQIKEMTKDTAPYFFSRKTLRFFGQTMRDFKVTMMPPYYRIIAPRRDNEGNIDGFTVRYFDPSTNELLNTIPEFEITDNINN